MRDPRIRAATAEHDDTNRDGDSQDAQSDEQGPRLGSHIDDVPVKIVAEPTQQFLGSAFGNVA